jgi:ATP-dependent Lhr-like helicase
MGSKTSSKPNVFDALARPIKKLLAERGFTEPTLPQSESIPKILEGKNVLLIAPAGTGKTEAAFLPVLHQLLLTQTRERGIKLVYITPLRALNRDMLERLEWWCRALDLRISVRHGDTEARERRAQALISPDVLITTPETLQIFLIGRRLSQHLRSVRWVIVDEIHELADNKRGAQLSLTLERLRKLRGGEFQLIGLSATIGSPQEVARFLVGVGRPCEVIDVSMARELELDVSYSTPTKRDERLASELYTYPPVAARLRAMRKLIEGHSSTLVFTNTRSTAEILASRFRLWDLHFPVSIHHGSLSSFSRLRAERGLKQGELKGVICTSSMELGIDIGRIDLVIQYNSPRQVTRLLQRAGRSGHRLGEVAKGVIMVQDPDDALESIVIAARSHQRELEPVAVTEKPLDVLLHALVSIMVVQRRGSVDEAYELFRRAYPFRDLEREDLLKVLGFAQSLERRLAWVSEDGKDFARPRATERVFNYYFNNLSMIPVLRQYMVVDDERNQPVGILDESFVAEYGEPGVKFVIGGEIWRVLQVFKDKVYVKPDDDPLGAIPTWIGEEIPVPHSVAQEVGKLRAQLEELERAGKKFEDAAAELAKRYRASEGAMRFALVDAHRQAEAPLPLPTDRRITIEKVKEICVVNACFGTLVNRTLARLLAYKASVELGETTATSADPYRILLRSETLEPEGVIEILRGELSADLRKDLRRIIEDSRFFRWRLAQVARRMGVLEREAELTSSVLDKLMRALKGTPAFEETFKEVVHKDLDLKRTLEVLGRIRSGEIELVSLGERAEPTPVSSLTWRQRYLALEPVMPGRLKLLAIASAKARLLSEARTFACTQCKDYVEELQLHELDEEPKCPRCGSVKLGMVETPAEEVQRAIELFERGRRGSTWRELQESAKLISQHGKLAALALVGRGVTPTVAREILAKEQKLSSKFLELLLRKEREALFRRFGWA